MIIQKDTPINQILSAYPESIRFFNEIEMSCGQCFAVHFETLEKGALMHGLEVSSLVQKLNKFIENLPSSVTTPPS